MPTYRFRNTNTGEIKEKFLSIYELDEFKAQHRHLTQMPTMLNTVGMIGGIREDDTFKDIMNSIKKNNPGNTMRNY